MHHHGIYFRRVPAAKRPADAMIMPLITTKSLGNIDSIGVRRVEGQISIDKRKRITQTKESGVG